MNRKSQFFCTYRSSWFVMDSMILSVLMFSRFFKRLSCVVRKLDLARPNASSSHLKPTMISRTICKTDSVPVIPSCTSSPNPTLPTLFVGNTKSTVIDSSLQLISTMSKWSTQKSSTCSRVQGPKAPPSCMVRDPIDMDPFLKPNRFSASLPPGATKRRCPL